jgi:GH25 family lysozyme M1 (1,4-beta-N-acetylmuramidase)
MPRRVSVVRLITAVALVAAVGAPAVSGSLSSASGAQAISGPDVSHYQHPNGKPIDWDKVAAAGKVFAISKATEGTTYNDPYFATDYPAELAAGLVHGSYHFAHPGLPIAGTAMDQAEFFFAAVGDVTTADTLPPALDLENTGGLSPGQLVTWAQDFLLDMRSLGGRTPMLYTYPNFWTNDLDDPTAFARYPLWMAEYGTSKAPVADIWQYTDASHIKGIPDAVDQSTFTGTWNASFPWSTLSDGTVVTPWKASAPGAPVALQASAEGGAATVSWLPGDTGTSAVTGYTVTATPGGKTVSVGPNIFNATVSGLSTSTAYTFTVTATNAVGVGVASAPSPPVTPTIPTVLATATSASLTYGGTLPIQATLRRADNHQGLADQKVLVFRRTSTAAPWRQIRSLSTNASGLASTVLQPTRSAQLEAVFPGSKGVARSSAYENYVVKPTVSAALSAATVAHGSSVTLSGSAAPFVAGQKVTLQKHSGGAWRLTATSTLGRKGRFKFAIQPTTAGTLTYRVTVAATSRFGTGHSPTVSLTVT